MLLELRIMALIFLLQSNCTNVKITNSTSTMIPSSYNITIHQGSQQILVQDFEASKTILFDSTGRKIEEMNNIYPHSFFSKSGRLYHVDDNNNLIKHEDSHFKFPLGEMPTDILVMNDGEVCVFVRRSNELGEGELIFHRLYKTEPDFVQAIPLLDICHLEAEEGSKLISVVSKSALDNMRKVFIHDPSKKFFENQRLVDESNLFGINLEHGLRILSTKETYLIENDWNSVKLSPSPNQQSLLSPMRKTLLTYRLENLNKEDLSLAVSTFDAHTLEKIEEYILNLEAAQIPKLLFKDDGYLYTVEYKEEELNINKIERP